MEDTEKFTVLAILIEDTDRAYRAATEGADSVETLGEGLTYEEALEVLANAPKKA